MLHAVCKNNFDTSTNWVKVKVPLDIQSIRRTKTIASALLIATCGTLPVMLVGTLGVQIKQELGLSDAQLGTVLACFYATSGVSAVWLGRFADRVGWRTAVRVAAVTSTVVLLGIAVAARSFFVLACLLAIGGLSHALAAPSGNLALAREVPGGRQGMIFGVKQSAVPLSAMLAGLSVAAIALTVGWRWAYIALLALPLVTLLSIPDELEGTATERSAGSPPPLRSVGRGLFLLTVGVGLANVTVSSLASFLVVSSVNAGLSAGAAGALVSIGSVASLVTRIGAGWLSDRLQVGGFRMVPALLLLGSLGFGLLATNRPVLLLPGAVLAYGAGWGWQGLFQFGVVSSHVEAPASATGITRVGLMTGSTIGPILFGSMSERLGYPFAWSVITVVAMASAILVFAGARRTSP